MFTILIIEDDPVLRNRIIEFLHSDDYSVLEADSAAEALELSNNYEGSIDLLITDQDAESAMRPTVAEQMRERRTGLKVLQTSGRPLEEPGDTYLLATPFSREALLKKIREILQPG